VPHTLNLGNDKLEDNLVVVFEEDLQTNVINVNSELRRVSNFNVFGMEAEDLKTVEQCGAYVLSSCIDVWCVVANKHLFVKEQKDVIVLNMEASNAIFYNYQSGSDELETLAMKWKSWATPALKHLLIPVNLHNAHWCLVIVDFENTQIVCWDSLFGYDKGKGVKKKLSYLHRFLRHFSGDKKRKWKNEIMFDDVPQQNITDCGIFCIEFMRAFINGYKASKDLEAQVSQGTMIAARRHIAREINERKIIERKEPDVMEDKRSRKKSKRAQDNDQKE
jgi:Ulp1 family protease